MLFNIFSCELRCLSSSGSYSLVLKLFRVFTSITKVTFSITVGQTYLKSHSWNFSYWNNRGNYFGRHANAGWWCHRKLICLLLDSAYVSRLQLCELGLRCHYYWTYLYFFHHSLNAALLSGVVFPFSFKRLRLHFHLLSSLTCTSLSDYGFFISTFSSFVVTFPSQWTRLHFSQQSACFVSLSLFCSHLSRPVIFYFFLFSN